MWEESMMPSKGKEARRIQRHAAGEEATAEEPVEPDTTAAVEKEPESQVWSPNQFKDSFITQDRNGQIKGVKVEATFSRGHISLI